MPENTPPYSDFLTRMCGPGWENLPDCDLQAVYGMAIVRAVLNLRNSDIRAVCMHLRTDRHILEKAYHNLSMNGIFRNNCIESDRKELEEEDITVWGYYGGYASGATGTYAGSHRVVKRKF